MNEVKSAIGTLKGWQDKPTGWTDFEVMVTGRQHPTKLSTNDAELAIQVKALGTNIGTFVFNEVESENINPKSNRPYLNRYLTEVHEGVVQTSETQSDASAGQATTSTAGGSPPPNQETITVGARYTEEEVKRFEDKERRDYRSRAWAHTIAAHNHTIAVSDDPLETFARLKPFQRKVYEDICGMFAYDAADDDIPF